MSPLTFPLRDFFRELLLQSGQFALFYLLMQFSATGWGLFSNLGHTSLLLVLVLQTVVLVAWGDRPWVRFGGSLLAPLVYSLLEAREGMTFLFNAAHAGFWVFSLVTGALQTAVLITRKVSLKATWEFLLTFLNVAIFLALYFYFDTQLNVTGPDQLVLDRIFAFVPEFLADPTHLYILWGGLLLAVGLALGRAEVLRLNERINTIFGQYVDREIRDVILSGEGTKSRQTELAVLFSDLRDFTASSEHADPQAVTKMLNLYFTAWTEVVARHGGVVDKFIGDAVMALFGLTDKEGACRAAVGCGEEMLARWPALLHELTAAGLPLPAGMGIGIHFGPVILGDIGSRERRNFTVVGDTVNTASRIESACKASGKTFLVSSDVREHLAPEVAARCASLGRLTFKGKGEAVEVWSVEGGRA